MVNLILIEKLQNDFLDKLKMYVFSNVSPYKLKYPIKVL